MGKAIDYTPNIRHILEKRGLKDPKEIEYVKNKITHAMRKKSCIDNFRICIDGRGEAYYNKQMLNGCCESYDEEIILHSGTNVLFGFNYGH